MPFVKLATNYANFRGTARAGKIIEVDAAEAKALVAAGSEEVNKNSLTPKQAKSIVRFDEKAAIRGETEKAATR